jgi:hypothetical protein
MIFPEMNRMNLVRWQKKGYIKKIINGWYCFAESESRENIPWLAANLLYQPSYISLHSALSYYNLIPEAVYTTTSVTTKKTNSFNTVMGNYSYNHVKTAIYGFGHTLIDFETGSGSGNHRLYANSNSRKILFAELEKAVLDFFYINSFYKTEKDIEYLRFDETVLNDIRKETLFLYLEKYQNKSLEERIFKMFKAYSL